MYLGKWYTNIFNTFLFCNFSLIRNYLQTFQKNKNKQNKVPERQTDYLQRRHISGEQISHQQEQRLEATELCLQTAKGMQFSL